jgi:hypothetical protein
MPQNASCGLSLVGRQRGREQKQTKPTKEAGGGRKRVGQRRHLYILQTLESCRKAKILVGVADTDNAEKPVRLSRNPTEARLFPFNAKTQSSPRRQEAGGSLVPFASASRLCGLCAFALKERMPTLPLNRAATRLSDIGGPRSRAAWTHFPLTAARPRWVPQELTRWRLTGPDLLLPSAACFVAFVCFC